jgi:hypothetical protein
LFKPQIKTVFNSVKEKMTALHYGQWEIMVNESLVRAGEIQYDKMHGATDEDILKRIRSEQARGFVWMDELDSLIETYKANRKAYPTFKSFLPEIAKFYKGLAPKANTLLSGFEAMCAHVVNVDPVSAKTELDANVTELSVHFDRPMASGISINLTEQGIEHFPLVRSKESIKWSDDRKTLTLKVQLKPAWNYGFILTSLSFKTLDGYPLRQYEVTFKTK